MIAAENKWRTNGHQSGELNFKLHPAMIMHVAPTDGTASRSSAKCVVALRMTPTISTIGRLTEMGDWRICVPSVDGSSHRCFGGPPAGWISTAFAFLLRAFRFIHDGSQLHIMPRWCSRCELRVYLALFGKM